MAAPSTPAGDEYDYIDQAVIGAHIAATEAAIAADEAGIVVEDDDDAYNDEEITDPGEFDGGYGPGSYYEHAMSKDD